MRKKGKQVKDQHLKNLLSEDDSSKVLTKTKTPPICMSFSASSTTRVTRSQKPDLAVATAENLASRNTQGGVVSGREIPSKASGIHRCQTGTGSVSSDIPVTFTSSSKSYNTWTNRTKDTPVEPGLALRDTPMEPGLALMSSTEEKRLEPSSPHVSPNYNIDEENTQESTHINDDQSTFKPRINAMPGDRFNINSRVNSDDEVVVSPVTEEGNINGSSAPSVILNTPSMGKVTINTRDTSEAGVDGSPRVGEEVKQDSSSPTNGDIIKTLKFMNSSLKGELSSVKYKVGQMTAQMVKVEKDLNSYENRWEMRMEALEGRISTVENNNQSLEKRWELHRTDQSKELSIIQTGIDSNSSAVLELKNEAKSNQEKWENLEKLENEIKTAADKKFQELRDVIKSELRSELLEEMRSSFAPNTEEIKEGLANIQDKILDEVRSTQASAVAEACSTQASAMADLRSEIKLERLKDQAFNKRYNIIVFGLTENQVPQADRRSVLQFFKERMNLHYLAVEETYRLGQLHESQNAPRPLVVRFKNIEDRRAVWNRRAFIKKDWDQPIWLQEDLPKKLREDNRVLNRIAKMARKYPTSFQNVRIMDFKIHINGGVYSFDDAHLLPDILQPKAVYTPRSTHTCVFFTKHSPLSNHHPSPFQLGDQSFVCVEQFLALRRAQLAGDELLAKGALETQDPAEHKAILNTLRADQPNLWQEKAEEYILQATRAKFGQNEALADFLIDTHPLELGEASKNTVWGIGLTLDSTEVFDVNKWNPRGNLLGKTLEKVRDELIDAYIK